jgi:hypothetical protein
VPDDPTKQEPGYKAPAPRPDPPEPTEPTDPKPGDDGKFDAEYVHQLRDEAAARRVESKAATERADAMAKRISTMTVADAAGPILTDPADLTRYVDEAELAGDDGLPDPELVKAAAEKLAVEKPGLAKHRVAGDAGQGPRGTPVPGATVDLADILKRAVR